MAERRSDYPLQFALSVPKRRFKKAVDRNQLRRRIREAYRLRKQQLYDGLPSEGPQYAFMVLYTGQEMMAFADLDKAMQQLIHRFLKKVRQQTRQTNHP